MDRKVLILLLVLFIFGVFLTGFALKQNGTKFNSSSNLSGENIMENKNKLINKSQLNSSNIQTGWTESVPPEYLKAAQQQGKVERLDYQSQDFVRDGTNITKSPEFLLV